MKIQQYPSIAPGEFDATHVRWLLTMVAEGIAFGVRLHEAGLVPPSVDPVWAEPMTDRWVQLIAKAAGTAVFNEDAEEDMQPDSEDAFLAESSSEDRDDKDDEEYSAQLAREAWYWSLQEAAMEGAYNLATLRAGYAIADGEGPALPAFVWEWYQTLSTVDWELAPGVYPPATLDTLTTQWLANATFELARRAGVPALANLELAHQAAQRALDYVVCDRLVHGDELYRQESPIEEADFAL